MLFGKYFINFLQFLGIDFIKFEIFFSKYNLNSVLINEYTSDVLLGLNGNLTGKKSGLFKTD